jgi:replication initiation and membrane attachment protein
MSYPWQHLNPKDEVSIRLEQFISNQDVHVLTTLYQPLIGSTAYTLYMALQSSVNHLTEWTSEQPLSMLLARLDIGIPEFYRARVRLEALGLLKVYRHRVQSDSYLYDVRAPLSAAAFFQDNMMRLLLFEKVGENVYKSLRSQFVSKRPEKEKYEEITQSFLDVYQFDIQKHNRMNDKLKEFQAVNEQSTPLSKKIVESNQFDWEFFQEGLNKHFIKKESINQELKELIYSFHTVYGIDELDMQRLILEATDVESGAVEKNKFIHIVHRTYHKGSPQKVKITDKVEQSLEDANRQFQLRQNTLKQKGFSEEELEIIEHAEEVTPGEYLSSIKQQKGGFVTSNEQWVLKELVEASPLHSSVINILINYILIIKGEAVLEKSLAIKIANDWAQKKVDSPEAAMEKVKQLYLENQEKRKQRENRRYSNKKKSFVNGRKESLPDWAEKKETNPDEFVSPEEEEAFKEKLRKLKERRGGVN